MVMEGGGYSKGKRAGDFFVQASVDGVPGFTGFTMVSRKGDLSEVTHLPMCGLLDMTVKVLDERVTMHLDYALQGVNEPVKIPNPA